jgi:hypothetical protein
VFGALTLSEPPPVVKKVKFDSVEHPIPGAPETVFAPTILKLTLLSLTEIGAEISTDASVSAIFANEIEIALDEEVPMTRTAETPEEVDEPLHNIVAELIVIGLEEMSQTKVIEKTRKKLGSERFCKLRLWEWQIS